MTLKPVVEREAKVPSSLSQMVSIIKFELLTYFRARRFYVLLAITLLISLLLTGVVDYYRPASYLNSTLDFYGSWWGGWAGLLIVLSGIFFGGDAISGEFQNKTGYFLIPNPIRRVTIYVGKWLAALIASIMIMALYAVVAIANGYAYFGASIPSEFWESAAFALLYLISVLGFTFFFSSLFKSSSISVLVTAMLFLFIFAVIQALVANLAQTEPWFILTYGQSIIANVFTVPYPPEMRTIVGPEGRKFIQYQATINQGLAIMAAYFVITAALGLILFERKEFN